MKRGSKIGLLAFIGLLLPSGISQAKENAPPQMTVDGTGFFKDRLLRQQFETIFEMEDSYYGPADIEDAALIIISEIQNDGHLEAKVAATITAPNGDIVTAEWDKELDVFLPRELKAVTVEFQVIPGPRFYFGTLTVEGNETITLGEVESFFFDEPFFFSGDKAKVFTKPQFTAGVQNLQIHLKNLGYQNAKVAGDIVAMNTVTGATDVHVTISRGPLYVLKEVTVESLEDTQGNNDFSRWLGKPYNTFIRQDIIQEIRNGYYELGFVDVQFTHVMVPTPVSSDTVEVLLKISIIPGKQFTVSKIGFEGANSVRRSLLENKLSLKPGDFLNPGLLDESRFNLSRLGLFHKVDIQVTEETENQRSITFNLKDRTTWEVDSLLGWGSYENLRVGITAEKVNALGLGHRLQFKAIASTKSLLAESRYLIPNFFNSQFPLSTKLFFLEREELSFDRQELGVSFGSSKYLKRLDVTVDAVYNFEDLDARINSRGGASTGPDNVRSGSLEFRFSRDKRDNLLNPQSGYRFFGDFEWGSEALGGQVDYQSAETGFSYHREIKRGLIWHGSISHAVVGSFNKSQSQVPTNKLLYPGGENSIRGYQRGGAAPFDNTGDYVGAKSLVLLNLELEQRLTHALSIVGFFDGLGMTRNIDEYPFDEYLSSIGLGIRFRTFMGPIRLEYGHNLDQRVGDPDGTFHLTIGYPF